MLRYKEKDILRIAKRINNGRRPYLLVNPLQAKHIPVAPSKALQMMTSLGRLVAEKYSEARLVIGFAETATAIGAVVAKAISDECLYIHTTRENVNAAEHYVYFTEEHSHATEQKLVADDLNYYFSKTGTIILVDDEFSTGKTLINMVNRLKEAYPALIGKRIVAASIINRLSTDNLNRWKNEGIESVCLLKLPNDDYTEVVEPILAEEARKCSETHKRFLNTASVLVCNLPDPRLGIVISNYYEMCLAKVEQILNSCELIDKRVVVLGTEECMLPALLIGEKIEEAGIAKSIKCHATTRSPIGICKNTGYPIKTGYHLHSFYDVNRDTYIYNLHKYDVAIIISDTNEPFSSGLYDLSLALHDNGCKSILCMVGENDV